MTEDDAVGGHSSSFSSFFFSFLPKVRSRELIGKGGGDV